MATDKVSQGTHISARFPRTAAMLEAAQLAEVLRSAAEELESISQLASRFDAQILRGITKSIVQSVVHSAIELEAVES